jgi:hypothetical protein
LLYRRECIISIVIYVAIKDGLSVAELSNRCKSMEISPSLTNPILQTWQNNSSAIAMSLLSKTLKANQLVDLDWNFGVTAATDDCNHMSKTFLQLKFTIDNGEEGLKNIFLELSLEQFYNFLSQMKSCKSYLDFVSS